MEEFEVQENVHTRSVSHVRETTGDYDGTSHGENPGSVEKGKGGKGGGKNKGRAKGEKNGETTKVEKPKKEKTEDQLARAVTQSYFSSIIFEQSNIYIYIFVSVRLFRFLTPVAIANHYLNEI